jgi:hypothetical protein
LRLLCPYTSPQNGRVERIIRTTTNMICCLLFQASLPTSYWAEALNTATHLLNRLHSKAVSHPTPHFVMYGTTPSYDHLRVFGCACYPNTSATAPHKLSPRSTRCLFLGYSPDNKGYCCLDLLSHHIIISRHVVFDEDVFPLVGSSPPTDLDSLLESDPIPQTPPLASLPVPSVGQTPRLAPTLTPSADPPTPLPAPRTALSTPFAPCVAPSTSVDRFTDPALVYHQHVRATASALAEPAPSTSMARFADPALVYRRREWATTSAPDDPPTHIEPPVYHPITIHRNLGHVHPMVTSRTASVLRPADRLILTADAPPNASPVPSSVRTAHTDPH